MKLLKFLKIIWGYYKFHMSVCLFILTYYLVGELNSSIEEPSLWFTHGWVSLIIPFIVVTPIILMLLDSYKKLKNPENH